VGIRKTKVFLGVNLNAHLDAQVVSFGIAIHALRGQTTLGQQAR